MLTGSVARHVPVVEMAAGKAGMACMAWHAWHGMHGMTAIGWEGIF